jgi:Skp family chaperone for outer membrane proteins
MRRTFVGLVGAGLVALALAAPLPAQAQSAPAIGTVDMGRINAEYQAIQQLTTQYQGFVREQQAKFEDRGKTRMLNDAELKEYMDLSQFGAPTEANKQRLTALAQESDTREKRLAELERKTRDEAEQKEYDGLSGIAKVRGPELAKLEDDLTQAVSAKREELLKVITDSVNAAVKAVAEQKKLTVVVAKAVIDPNGGSAPLVLYGGTDITDDVLAKLNAAPAAAAAPGKAAAGAAAQPKPAAGAPAAPANSK